MKFAALAPFGLGSVRGLILVGIAAVGLTGFRTADGAEIESNVVFARGMGDYHTYRIPAVIRASNGDLLAFCEGRKDGGGDSGNIDLLMKRSTDGGSSWSEYEVLWDDEKNTCGNPCPVVDSSTGTIHLLLTHNLGEDHEAQIKLRTARGTRTVWIMQSEDDGQSWTEPKEITEQAKDPEWTWYATGPGVGIQIERGPHAGRLVIPCDHGFPYENGTRTDGQSETGSHVIFSDDHGKTWERSEWIVPAMNECQVVELNEPAGALLINMRSYRGTNLRAQSTSLDGGATWTDPVEVPDLPEPVCQASIIRADSPVAEGDGMLIFSNPSSKKRDHFTVKLSRDGGEAWSAGTLLWKGPAAYSSLVMISDEEVGCLYERGEKNPYETIVFTRLKLAELEK